MAMDPLDAIKQTYFQECDELLLSLEEGLLAMENGQADDEIVNAVFRAVHSIKGGGGAFGLTNLVSFSHVFETVMDLIRSEKLSASPDVVRALLRASDTLADHVRVCQNSASRPPGWDSEVKAVLERIASGNSQSVPVSAPETNVEFSTDDFRPVKFEFDDEPAQPGASQWRIFFRPRRTLFAKANEPFLVLRELATLGALVVTADLTAIPALDQIDLDDAYLSWEMTLETPAGRAEIEGAFDFVVDDCDLTIEPFALAAMAPMAEEPERVEVSEAAPVGLVGAPVADSSKADNAASAPKPTVRVDLEKVDRLVNLVGEMVIAQAMLIQQAAESGLPVHSPVNAALKDLDLLLRDLQESVMAVRTQPVKSVFQRMPRLVRELGAQTGKQVHLLMEGEATEVDKTVIERLGEPLTHMIRNAIDHGLESPEVRRAAGKPDEGTVRLSAEHRGGRIVIVVSDDGAGINRERVKAKAIERDLITAGANLSDEEVDNLIFLPGFSTASCVSDISGRGVGMDVVRRSITDLGGRIVICSVPGKGSRFTLTLPLTLAVLDGMLVGVGEQTFVVPLTHIVESLRPRKEDVQRLGLSASLLNVRGSYVPLVKVNDLLGEPGGQPASSDCVVILVESDGIGRVALEVDRIIGQRQVVIKSFENNYGTVDGIAAATILGNGRVALILDVDGLVARCRTAPIDKPLELRQVAGGTA